MRAKRKTQEKRDTSAQSAERFATLEAQSAAFSERMERHSEEDKAIHAAMNDKLDEIRETLSKQRGFIAGMMFVITVAASLVGWAISYFKG